MVDIVTGEISFEGSELIKHGVFKNDQRLADGTIMPSKFVKRRCALHEGEEWTYDRAFFRLSDLEGWLCICRVCNELIPESISLDRVSEALQEAAKRGYARAARWPEKAPQPAKIPAAVLPARTVGQAMAMLDDIDAVLA